MNTWPVFGLNLTSNHRQMAKYFWIVTWIIRPILVGLEIIILLKNVTQLEKNKFSFRSNVTQLEKNKFSFRSNVTKLEKNKLYFSLFCVFVRFLQGPVLCCNFDNLFAQKQTFCGTIKTFSYRFYNNLQQGWFGPFSWLL